jgi:formylglycine-generating enzyme required for sulfatase activity
LRVLQFIAVTWLVLACAFDPAHAEKRVALVIGNDRYANLPAGEQLHSAVNDARAIGEALKDIGFDVIAGENLNRSALVDRFGDLLQRLVPGDTAFFFFSGHGVALDGVNYILPVDVPNVVSGQEARMKLAALGETDIIAELGGRGVRVAVVVLDACRTNPFARPGAKAVGGDKGLAPPPQVKGVFSLYAASAGQSARDQLADDDNDPNSVFTRVLAPLLKKQGLDLRDLAYEVREEVARRASRAGYEQWPAYYDGTIGGRVYLAGLPAPRETQPVSEAERARRERAERAWGLIQNTTSLAAVDDFLGQFGDVPMWGPAAQAKREELLKKAPPPSGSQVAMADTAVRRDGVALTAAQERGLKPKDTFRECENCPEMVVVPAGSFTMGLPAGEKGLFGDQGPQHTVTIGRPFAVGKLHVTVDQFAASVKETGYAASSACYKWGVRGGNGSWRDPGFKQEGSHPVVCVSWDDAKAYAEWLADKTHKPYRLLTEAEFEYAARGQTAPSAYPRFWFGNDDGELCRYGNGLDQTARNSIAVAKDWTVAACNDGYAYTSPAGHYKPNTFGLYDMAGNAWQWTQDCYHDSYSGAPADGSAWIIGCKESGRVVRGGSWSDLPPAFRADSRGRLTVGDWIVGFRVAQTLTP